MSAASNPTPADAMRKQALGLLVKIGAAVAILWAGYFCTAVLGVDPLHGFGKPEGNSAAIYFWMALVATIGAVPFAGWKLWQLRQLGHRGVATMARPVRIGTAGSGGLRTVEFVYAAANAQHRMKVDVPAAFAANYTKATQLPALYDPQQPGRCRLLQLSVNQPGAQPASVGVGKAVLGGVMEASGEITQKVVIVLILAAAVGGVFGIARLLAGAQFVHDYRLSLLLGGAALGGLALAAQTKWEFRHSDLAISPKWLLLVAGILAAGSAYWAWSTHSTLEWEAQQQRDVDARDAELRGQAAKARAGIETLQKLNALRQQQQTTNP